MADADSKKEDNKMQQVSDMLMQGVHDLFTSEKYKTYLQTMSKFSEYSINNQILIAQQNPNATLIAGYQSWRKNFGRQVRAGEKGIKIIAPMPVQRTVKRERKDENGNVLMTENGVPQIEQVSVTVPKYKMVTVFDISQTTGQPLPERPGVETLTARVDDYSMIMQALRKISPVPVKFDNIEGTANGYYSATEKEIVIRTGMPEAQTVKTLIHEVVHAKCHDPDKLRNMGAERIDVNSREVEAESVAYMVANSIGIDTSDYTFPYVAAWSSSVDMPELRNSMAHICNASTEIISDLQAKIEAERELEETKTMQDKILSTDRKTLYEIYQIDKPHVEYKYMGTDFADKLRLKISADDYECVYKGTLINVEEDAELDTLFCKFNVSRPADFTGHSLVASDVIVLHHGQEKQPQAWYVDTVGYKPLPHFMEELQQNQLNSLEANLSCKKAIQEAIDACYDYKSGHLDTDTVTQSVINKFGADRVQHVLAVTVRLKSWDGRFSPETKKWAEDLTKNEDFEKTGVDKKQVYIVDSHPSLVDGLITHIRHLDVSRDMDQDKRIVTFAERLDRLSETNDLYEYKDRVTNMEQHVQEITEQIKVGKTEGISEWLKTIVNTSNNNTDIMEAKALLKDLDGIEGNRECERIDLTEAHQISQNSLASDKKNMDEKMPGQKKMTIKEKLKIKQKHINEQDSWPDGQSGREELSL